MNGDRVSASASESGSSGLQPDASLADMHVTGPSLSIANEFSEIVVRRVVTRNGARLLIESPRTGKWIMLCPLELESLTWQNTATFSALIGTPSAPLVSDDNSLA